MYGLNYTYKVIILYLIFTQGDGATGLVIVQRFKGI